MAGSPASIGEDAGKNMPHFKAKAKAKASRLTSVSLPFGSISDGRPPDRDSNLRSSDHWASVLTTSPRPDPLRLKYCSVYLHLCLLMSFVSIAEYINRSMIELQIKSS